MVDGRRVKALSAGAHRGQRVTLSADAQRSPVVHDRLQEAKPTPPYLERDQGGSEGRLLRPPEREEIPLPVPINDRLIVEYYA